MVCHNFYFVEERDSGTERSRKLLEGTQLVMEEQGFELKRIYSTAYPLGQSPGPCRHSGSSSTWHYPQRMRLGCNSQTPQVS
jgi:hypothetical protein